MQSMLSTFSGMFSAENAQKKLSLLAGREGETIAASCVTLMDDALLPGGMASTPFDAEGSACSTKAIIENGVLKTLLHNRKTARKQGVKSTGNASRGGVGGPVRVAPTNLYLVPGEKDLPTLMETLDDGLLITEVSGLHAGANPVSGDFSLIAKGFLVVNGKKDRPVEQITVAGNFYQLLKGICEVGSDLTFRGLSVGSPSVLLEGISVSGSNQVQA
jgi:PmbA protein